jgi:type I restriction enzyme R subunit
LTAHYLGGASREQLDPILDVCVAVYKADLDEDGQVAFKGSAKAFVRTYNFLASILPYNNADWEKLSLFFNFLIPKLPAPQETDLAKGILEAVDMDSYRAEVQASLAIALEDKDGVIEPVPVGEGGWKPEPELERLSAIIKTFNELFGGNSEWRDIDRVERTIAEDIPAQVAADTAYQNAMRYSDLQNARVEFEKALSRVMVGLVADQTELFKLFSDNDSFKKWLSDAVFGLTYQPPSQLEQSAAYCWSLYARHFTRPKPTFARSPRTPRSLRQHFTAIVHRVERLRAQQRESERQAEHLFQTLLHRAFVREL